MPSQNHDIFKNKVIILFISLLIMAGVLTGFTYLKQAASQSLLVYPVRTNCLGINKLFTIQVDYLRYGEIDKQPTLEQKGTGVYQCYCKEYGLLSDGLDSTNFCYDY